MGVKTLDMTRSTAGRFAGVLDAFVRIAALPVSIQRRRQTLGRVRLRIEKGIHCPHVPLALEPAYAL